MLNDLDPDQNLLFPQNSQVFSYSDLPLNAKFNQLFSLFYSNVRSLPCNNQELYNCLQLAETNFSIIALTETWLTDNNKTLYDIPNYNSVHSTRVDRRGGGVSLYIDSTLHFKQRIDLNVNNKDIESLFIEILPTENTIKPMIVGVIYRPPNTNMDFF